MNVDTDVEQLELSLLGKCKLFQSIGKTVSIYWSQAYSYPVAQQFHSSR